MGEAGFEVGEGGEQEGGSGEGSGKRAIVHYLMTEGKGGCGWGAFRWRCVATGQAGFDAERLASTRPGLAAPVLTHLA